MCCCRRVWLSWSAFRIIFYGFHPRVPQPWPSRQDLHSVLLDRVPDLFSYPSRTWPTEDEYRSVWKVGASHAVAAEAARLFSLPPFDASFLFPSLMWC